MRTKTTRQALRSCAIAGVLMCLTADVLFSQVQPRSATQPPIRRQRQQNQNVSLQSSQFGQSDQSGQPDFARRMAERHMRQMQEMQRDMEEMQRQAEENKNRALQQAVGASDEQWRQLKPRLERILQFKAESEVSLRPGSGDGGNFQSVRFGNPSGGGMGGGFMSFGGSGEWHFHKL